MGISNQNICLLQCLVNLMECVFIFQVDLFKHLIARASCLIVLPAVVYMIIFAVHFQVLNRR